ncbi:hypothetical protein [Halanaerobium hydrogeniformans]|uniref:Uncharacterized protein n=1 Tax=Halanaerobium hydrogeniformans TaxID=656519 RepID=E4RLW8_HALHG|nr:hypothetical protein [Halanaerobium hydrogeniformans]ADQ14051.1 hypothetical protein Halsa_0589 [Halanaerobium hydrogeniformans]
MYKDNYKKLKAAINKLKSKYDFKGLYHFTDFKNLKSIIETEC